MPKPTRSAAAIASLVALALAACTAGSNDGGADRTTSAPPVTEVTSTPTASPTPPALPETPPATRGPVASDCEKGWVTPPEGSPRYAEPLEVIRRTTGVEAPLVVVDLRFFEGPESPPSDKGYLSNVRRWYVKAFAPDDLAFQGRFLVEARAFGSGLVAVAPYDTNGFRSPDWVGFQFDGGQARAYEGLPGLWAGIPYDFVAGGAGLEIPGLPEEVAGCLDAT